MNEEEPTFLSEENASKVPILQERIFGTDDGYIQFAISVTTSYLVFMNEIIVNAKTSMVTEVIGYLPEGIKFTISFFGNTALEIMFKIQ